MRSATLFSLTKSKLNPPLYYNINGMYQRKLCTCSFTFFEHTHVLAIRQWTYLYHVTATWVPLKKTLGSELSFMVVSCFVHFVGAAKKTFQRSDCLKKEKKSGQEGTSALTTKKKDRCTSILATSISFFKCWNRIILSRSISHSGLYLKGALWTWQLNNLQLNALFVSRLWCARELKWGLLFTGELFIESHKYFTLNIIT